MIFLKICPLAQSLTSFMMGSIMKQRILKAVEILRNDGVVAIPTETVYGLAAGIFFPTAIQKIFTLKNRSQDNPLIAHISHLKQAEEIARGLPIEFYQLAKAFFPGPLTLVVKKNETVPKIVSAGKDTIAIRMPKHPIAQLLIETLDMPVVAPSANLSGRPSPTCAQHVFDDFKDQIPLILDGGDCEIGIESTIISLVEKTPQILREGAISQEEIERVLHRKIEKYTGDEILAPGMKYKHYSPKVPVRIFQNKENLEEYLQKHSAKKVWVLTSEKIGIENERRVDEKNLYSLFRESETKVDELVILLTSHLQSNKGLLDRVIKASR